MKVTFLGAAKTVTGSNFLVEAAGQKFLVDCGMYQGKVTAELENSDPFLYDPSGIDFMILTHAHIDHSGRIPKLYNEGFKGPVYATKATVDLCSIMLPDSGHIQEMEAEWNNRKRMRESLEEIPPLYTADDAYRSMEIFRPVEYDEIIDITDSISVRFNDAGHMLGSAIVEIWVTENGKTNKVVFSGDIGNNDLPLLASPTMIENADYLIMESTYGNRLHMRNDEKARLFLQIVSETLDKGGTVVIPSFAVGRTQEILYEINKLKDQMGQDLEFARQYQRLMQTNVYVDSPLAINATEIFKKHAYLFDDEIKNEIMRGDNPLDFPGLNFTQTVEESKALNSSNEACIILSASGMCDVGRIKHHLKHNLWNPKSTILFVGYQAPGTLGRSIVDGAKKVKIFGEEIAINARIEYIEGYSGHADQEWLLNFVYSFHTNRPKHIFLVHGEEESQAVLKDKIQETTGIPVTIPGFGDSYELGPDLPVELERTEEVKSFDKHLQKLDLLDRIDSMKDEIAELENSVKAQVVDSNDEKINELNERLNEIQEQIKNMMNN